MFLMLDVFLTSTLPLLVLRGVLDEQGKLGFNGLKFRMPESPLILLNPFQTNFTFYQKTLYRKTKNLLKMGFVTKTKYLKILHGTVVNGVQGRI